MSYEAEYLYAALHDPGVLQTWPVEPQWFLDEGYRRAFGLWQKLADKGALCLSEVQKTLGSKGASWLTGLLNNRLGYAEAAAWGLQREYARHRIREIGLGLDSKGRDPTADPEEASAEAMDQLAHVRSRQDGPVHVREVLRETMTYLDRCWAAGGSLGIKTGFALLDAKIGGLEEDKLYLVGARPKAGKTAIALQIATKAAEDGHRVYFASREMGAVQLGARLLSMESRVDGLMLRSGRLKDHEYVAITEIAGRMVALGDRLTVDTRAQLPFEQLRASILRENARSKIGLIVVDYIQLLRLQKAEENRAAELERISYALKVLAREIHAPVLCLAQLNRDQEESKPPSMDKLKGSGGLEQAADAVFLLWKPDPKDLRTVELIIAANRDGPTGKFRLAFQPEFTRFE